MRKTAISFLILFCFLSGCTEKSTSLLILNSVSFSADIRMVEEHYVVDCVIDGQKELSATVNYPENLCGINFLYGNNGCRILYDGMEIVRENSCFPQTFIIGIIKQIFDAVDGKEFNVSNGNGKVDGELNGQDYSLIAAPGGLPIFLEIPGMNLEVYFNNVSLI